MESSTHTYKRGVLIIFSRTRLRLEVWNASVLACTSFGEVASGSDEVIIEHLRLPIQ